ncbi:MAG: hypothetical protein KOO69_08525, partial [Victivallales bacterium]|nr:hypothetical protein [Victivallales bacterium]
MIKDAKNKMRKYYLAERKALDADSRASADSAVCAALCALSMVKKAKCVAAYISDGTEVDLTTLLHECGKA